MVVVFQLAVGMPVLQIVDLSYASDFIAIVSQLHSFCRCLQMNVL